MINLLQAKLNLFRHQALPNGSPQRFSRLRGFFSLFSLSHPHFSFLRCICSEFLFSEEQQLGNKHQHQADTRGGQYFSKEEQE